MQSTPITITTEHNPLHHSLLIIWYYLCRGILTAIAYVFNRSFLIHHPSHLFPTNVSPPWNRTIHSFYPSSTMRQYLHPRYPTPLPNRIWLHPHHLPARMIGENPLFRAIILDGKISGPPLRQGMIALQQKHLIYIGEELGRWPSREDYITTYAVSISTNNSFRLFIPIQLVDRYGIHDSSPLSPFSNPIPLNETVQAYYRLKPLFPSLLPRKKAPQDCADA
jgi:hypothetical protein